MNTLGTLDRVSSGLGRAIGTGLGLLGQRLGPFGSWFGDQDAAPEGEGIHRRPVPDNLGPSAPRYVPDDRRAALYASAGLYSLQRDFARFSAMFQRDGALLMPRGGEHRHLFPHVFPEQAWDRPISPGGLVPPGAVEAPPSLDVAPWEMVPRGALRRDYVDAQGFPVIPDMRPMPLPQQVSVGVNVRVVSVGSRLGVRVERQVKSDLPKRERGEEPKERGRRQTGWIMSFVTATYGRYTEMFDLWEAIAWNVYGPEGQSLRHLSDGQILEMLLRGEAHIDLPGAVADYAVTQAMDQVLGRLSSGAQRGLNAMGWNKSAGLELYSFADNVAEMDADYWASQRSINDALPDPLFSPSDVSEWLRQAILWPASA